MDKNKTIVTFQLDTNLLDLLNQLADIEDRSLSSVIRNAIKEYLINHKVGDSNG